MSSHRVRSTLSTFGLSAKEIDAYLAVLEHGAASTRTVSTAADVSQSYVYEIAGELADRGLVTIDEGTSPTTIRARPPADAVDALSAQLDGLEEALSAVYSEPASEGGEFAVLHAHQTVCRRAERLIEGADHEVFLTLTPGGFDRLAPVLSDAIERGVYVYCLLAVPAPADPLEERADLATHATVVRTWDSHAPTFVIADLADGLLGSHGVLEGFGDSDYAFAFGHPEVAAGFHGNAVSNVWPMGEERFVAEPPPLPASFDSVRNAVTTAAVYRRRGTDLRVDLDAHDLQGADVRRLEGVPVREVRQNLVEPATNAFPIENSLVLETEEGLVSVSGALEGNIGPFYEEFVTDSVRLSAAE